MLDRKVDLSQRHGDTEEDEDRSSDDREKPIRCRVRRQNGHEQPHFFVFSQVRAFAILLMISLAETKRKANHEKTKVRKGEKIIKPCV